MKHVKQIFFSLLTFLFLPAVVLALGHDNYVVTRPGKNYFTLAGENNYQHRRFETTTARSSGKLFWDVRFEKF